MGSMYSAVPSLAKARTTSLVYLTANVSKASGSYSALSFNAAAHHDDAGMWDGVATFTIPTGAKKARLRANVTWDNNTGGGDRIAAIGHSILNVYASNQFLASSNVVDNSATQLDTQEIDVQAGDQFLLLTYQSSGAAVNIVSSWNGARATWFEIEITEWETPSYQVADQAFVNAIWADDFNYIANRGSGWNSTVDNPFVANGPWTNAKDLNTSTGSAGFIYTVNPLSIPGNTINPCLSSSRVLCLEALPGTYQRQTDFYLERNDLGNDANVLPAESWIQAWIYIPRSGAQMSEISDYGGKLFYPCRGGHGSCTTMSGLLNLRGAANHPNCNVIDPTVGFYPVDIGSENRTDLHSMDETGTGCQGAGANQAARGPHNAANYFQYNTWYLIKYRLDTTGANGITQLYVRQYGGAWELWMDWQGGVTPATYQFAVDPANQGVGHDFFRLLTTFGHPTNAATWIDSWFYIGDLHAATSEANLESRYAA